MRRAMISLSYVVLVAVGLGLAGLVIYRIRVNSQEFKVWLAAATWFSDQGMNGTVDRSTFLPAKELGSRPLIHPGWCSERVPLDHATIETFYDKNRESYRIVFGHGKLASVTERQEDASFTERLVAKLIHQESGDGQPTRRLVFSRVAFEDRGRLAVLYAEYLCPLCGFGGYFVLEQQGNEWVVRDVCPRWES